MAFLNFSRTRERIRGLEAEKAKLKVEDLQAIQLDILSLKAIDPNLGVKGLPQSATGQAVLLTGINIPAELGYHYGPKPNPEVAQYLDGKTIFSKVVNAGKKTALLYAYPPRYFDGIDSGKRLYSSIRRPARLHRQDPAVALGQPDAARPPQGLPRNRARDPARRGRRLRGPDHRRDHAHAGPAQGADGNPLRPDRRGRDHLHCLVDRHHVADRRGPAAAEEPIVAAWTQAASGGRRIMFRQFITPADQDPGPTQRVPVRTMRGESMLSREDLVAVEAPLEIRIAAVDERGPGQPVSVTMRTPGQDAELALGCLTKNERYVDSEKDTTDDSYILSISSQLYRNIRMINDLGFSTSESHSPDETTDTYFLNGSVDAQLTQQLSGNPNFGINRAEGEQTSDSNTALLILNYRPGRFINMTGSVNYTDTDSDVILSEGVILDWLPLPALRLNMSYQHSKADPEPVTTDTVSGYGTWYLTKFADLRLSSSYTRRVEDTRTETFNFSANINCRF